MTNNDHPGVAVLVEATHRPQPRLQPPMAGLDPVVGVPLGAMPGRWQQILEHHRVRRRSIGDHLNGCHLGRADGLFENWRAALASRVLAHRGLRQLAKRLEAASLAKRGVTR
jgi:hypothetical protein